MFGTFYDSVSGRLVIPQGLLAHFERHKTRRYAAEPFLNDFKAQVLPGFRWTEHNFEEGLAREVLDRGFPPNIEAILGAELQQHYASPSKQVEQVYFESGNPTTKILQRQLLREVKELADLRARKVTNPDVRQVLNYLNGLPRNSFSKIVARNLATAWQIASSLKKDYNGNVDAAKTMASRGVNLRLLTKVFNQPKPFYQPSSAGNSVRLFPLNESMLMLSREVRRGLTSGWVEYDLQSSQLAIVASLWGIDSIQAFLATPSNPHKSIWDLLLDHLTITDPTSRDSAKRLLKTALYSLIFGMHISKIKGEITKGMNKISLSVKGAEVFTHPLIHAIEVARDKAFQEVKDAGGLTTIFGDKLKVEASHGTRHGLNVYSLLAQQAQAMEFALVLPAFEFAKRHHREMTIALLQHDGFTVSYRVTGDKRRWLEKGLCKVVRLKAQELGIHTRLLRS